MRVRDRLFAWVVTGPVGRLAGFLLDLGAALIEGMRRRRRGEPDH